MEGVDGQTPIIENWLHYPDSSNAGWFDYATAIIGINLEYAPPGEPIATKNFTFFAFSEVVLSHEKIHLLQAIGFPFFWHWCCVWRRLTDEAFLSAAVGSAQLRDVLRGLPSLIDQSLRTEIKTHVSILSKKTDFGLSALSLLEAHATLGEIWLHARCETPTDICSHLDRLAPSSGYRLAFDVARQQIGDNAAVTIFPALVSAAFCFDLPVRAFSTMLKQRSHGAIEERSSETIESLCEIAISAGLRLNFYGFPDDQGQQLAGIESNLLVANCVGLLEKLEQRGLTLASILSERRMTGVGVAMLDPTILYGVDGEGHSAVVLGNPPADVDGAKDSPEYADFKFERVMMAVSQRLLKDCAGPSVEDVPPEYTWLQFVSEERLLIEIPPVGMQSVQALAQRVITDLSIRELRAPLTRESLGIAYLGHGVLKFIIDSPLEVWLSAGPRAFVRALSNLCPEFPIFLSPEPEDAMLMIWFGCLADPEAVSAAGFNASHPSSVVEIERFIEGVEKCCHVTGFDLVPLLDRFLAPFIPVD